MAISVDRVYQKVLALTNKEQRGYITPQEFNLFADQAQTEIFEQYFYDLEQFERNPQTSIDSLLEQKIQIFIHSWGVVEHGATLDPILINGNYCPIHDIQNIYLHDSTSEMRVPVQRVEQEYIPKIKSGALLRNFSYFNPVYFVYNNTVFFHPVHAYEYANGSYNTTQTFHMVVIRKPIPPNWTYLIDPTTKNALYNSDAADHRNFELHSSDENSLVIKILQLAGVNIKDYNLTQIAGQKEISTKQQEKL